MNFDIKAFIASQCASENLVPALAFDDADAANAWARTYNVTEYVTAANNQYFVHIPMKAGNDCPPGFSLCIPTELTAHKLRHGTYFSFLNSKARAAAKGARETALLVQGPRQFGYISSMFTGYNCIEYYIDHPTVYYMQWADANRTPFRNPLGVHGENQVFEADAGWGITYYELYQLMDRNDPESGRTTMYATHYTFNIKGERSARDGMYMQAGLYRRIAFYCKPIQQLALKGYCYTLKDARAAVIELAERESQLGALVEAAQAGYIRMLDAPKAGVKTST